MSRAQLMRILRHELRLVSRARATWITCPALVAVVTCAVWNGQRWVDHQQTTIDRVRAADIEAYRQIHAMLEDLERRDDPRPDLQLAGMAWYIFQPGGAVAPAPHIDPRRPEAAASEWVGARHAVLPPAPLAALATGQSDLYPYYTRVTIRTRPVLVHSDELESPANLLQGRFDVAFVLTFCWPLLALPLLYDVVSKERESGTLALVASQPISLRAVLAVRLAIRSGVPIAVTTVTSLAALVAYRGLGEITVDGLAVWAAAIIGTGVFWGGAAALINVSRWRSAANATALTACWLALAVIAPAVIDQMASVLAPVPSRIEFVNAVRTAGNLSSSQLAALVSAYYDQHPDASPSTQSADVTAIRGLAQQDALDRRIDPILSRYRESLARRQALVDQLRFLSAPTLIHDAVLELAGTSTTRFRRFADQVDAYHHDWRAYFYPLVHARASMTPALYEAAPRFTFRDEPRRQTVARALGLIVAAALPGIALLAIALRWTRRTAVR